MKSWHARSKLAGVSIVIAMITLISQELDQKKVQHIEESNTSSKQLNISLSSALSLFYDQNSVFIDVRASQDYLRGHIRGAISIPYSEIRGNAEYIGLRQVSPDKTLIVYCDSIQCSTAMLAAKALSAKHSGVYVYGGGWSEWSRFQLPVQK